MAKRAGVNRAVPAHHFGDVRGLLTALAAEGFRRLQATLDDADAGASDPRDRAIRAGLGCMRFAVTRPAPLRHRKAFVAILPAMAGFRGDGGLVTTTRKGLVFLRAIWSGAFGPVGGLTRTPFRPVFFPVTCGEAGMRLARPRGLPLSAALPRFTAIPANRRHAFPCARGGANYCRHGQSGGPGGYGLRLMLR